MSLPAQMTGNTEMRRDSTSRPLSHSPGLEHPIDAWADSKLHIRFSGRILIFRLLSTSIYHIDNESS